MARPILFALIVMLLGPHRVFAQLHIHHMTVQGDTLLIHGSFGSDSGGVIADKDAKPVVSWSDSLIRLTLPRSIYKGYAYRIAVGADTSNTRWLTQWSVGASFEQEYHLRRGEWQRIDVQSSFAGDISSYFLEPDLEFPAKINGLTIYPGDIYQFDGLSIIGQWQDTALLRPSWQHHSIEIKHEPWYQVRNASGMISQSNTPPDSVLDRARVISHRRPLDGYKAKPEAPLLFAWRPRVLGDLHQIQVMRDKSLIMDSIIEATEYTLPLLDPSSNYTWRVRTTSSVDSAWTSWWSFTTEKLDRVAPIYSQEILSFEHVITFGDTGRFASGLKKIEVQANSDSVVRILPGRLIDGKCELTTDPVTIEQLDTLVTIKYAVIITDCEDNTTSYYDSIPARPFKGPASVEVGHGMTRRSYVVKRGEWFMLDDEIRSVKLYDVAGNEVHVQIDGAFLETDALAPGMYLAVYSRRDAREKQYLLKLP